MGFLGLCLLFAGIALIVNGVAVISAISNRDAKTTAFINRATGSVLVIDHFIGLVRAGSTSPAGYSNAVKRLPRQFCFERRGR
jgi:hypothetical protein